MVVDVKGNSEKLIKHLTKNGYIIAAGYGKRKDMHVRIANFPAHKISDVKKLLSVIE
jgi:aspartate aminotransferase-like enzyme